jgi:hypothetical protein
MSKERREQMGSHIEQARNTPYGNHHAIPNAHVCPRCKGLRNSAIHKRKCKINPNPAWN